MMARCSGDGGNRTHGLGLPKILGLLLAAVLLFPAPAIAKCRTKACHARVHDKRVYNYVERKVKRITPYRCYGQRSVVPCYIITRESKGSWTVLNTWTSGAPCLRRACGFYQFLGWNVPWPVVVRSGYRTLKNKLAHHRQAAELWRQQRYQGACHWCGG